MFSHVMVGTRDLARMGRFHDAVLLPLGLLRRWKGQDDRRPPGIGWAAPQEPFDRRRASAGNGSTVAFVAPSPEAVREARAAGPPAADGTDVGAPGEHPRHGLGYHGAWLRAPEGNAPHVVHRGDRAAG
jgi:hypothetical protein